MRPVPSKPFTLAQASGDLFRHPDERRDAPAGASFIHRFLRLQAPAVATFRRFSAKAVASRRVMAPQGLEKIDSAPGNRAASA